MNKNLHRVVFNKARGIRMVVQETAASDGKAGNGSTQVARAGSDMSSANGVHWGRALLRDMSLIHVGAAAQAAGLLALTLGVQASFAQIIADPSAPNRQRPTVLESANGTPTVNIQTPSAGGVSRNTYQQFDIGQQGAILNNSRTNTQTQIGGWIQGNPWLANGGGRVIVNEVNSAAQSRLMGPLEVAGQRADVIIANPSGLVVDGLSFLNAAGVTLTTGRPLYGANGSLDGFRVQGGQISLQGSGMDATKADYANVLARAFSLNAGLWAQDLRVVTGVNRIAADGSVQQSNLGAAGAGPAKPQFALDVAQLGGMYAGKIFMVGTEAGLGVRNAGTVTATSGHLTLTADGQLSNSGVMASNDAAADLSLVTRGVDNSGTLGSQRDVVVNDGGVGTRNAGTVQASRQLLVQSGQLSNLVSGSLTAQRLEIAATGLSNAGSITQTGLQDLSIHSARLSNMGSNAVLGAPPASTGSSGTGTNPGTGGGSTGSGTGPATAPTSGLDGSAIQTTPVAPMTLANGSIQVTDGLSNTGKLSANGATDVTASQALRNSGTVNVRQLNSEGVLDNSSGTLTAQGFSGTQTSFQNRSGSLFVQGDLQLAAQSLDNTAGSIGSAQSLTVNARNIVINNGGTLASGTDLTLQAQELQNDSQDHHSGRIVSNAGNITLGVVGAMSNRQGQIGTVSDASDAQVSIQARSLDNTQGEITQSGTGQLRITVSEALQSKQAAISSNGSARIQAGSLGNDSGKISALKQLEIAVTEAISNVAGSLQAGDDTPALATEGSLKIQAGSNIDNRSGTLFASAGLTMTAAGIDNAMGAISAMGDMAIQSATTLNNNSGKLQSNGAVDILAGQRVSNQSGTIASGGPLQIKAQDLQTEQGQISSAKDATIVTQSLDNTGGTIAQTSSGRLSITASNALKNSSAKIISNGDLQISAGYTSNESGEISSLHSATLQVTALNSERGLIQSGTSLKIESASDITNRAGLIQAQGLLALNAQGQLSNAGGQILASGAAAIHSADLDNSAGIVSGTDTLTARTGVLKNDQGTIAANSAVNLQSTALSNQAGQIGAQTIAIDTQLGALNNDAGKIIASSGNLDLQSGALHSANGWLQAAQDLQINTHGQILTNAGTVLALGNATVHAGDVNNTGGTMQAGRDASTASALNLHSTGKLTNAGGHVLASADAGISAHALDNSNGTIGAGHHLTVQTQAAITNSAGKLAGNAGVNLGSASLSNDQQGVIGSSTGDVSMATGTIDNRTGSITAKGAVSVSSQSLDNTLGHIGAGRVNLNTQGRQLTNTDGQILASSGDLSLQSGWLDNQRGRIAALQNATLTSNGIRNDEGRITADSLQIQSRDGAGNWGAVSNQSGAILADQRLQLDSAALNNTAGAIQTTASTSALAIDSHGGDITNRQSGSAGGIVSSGTLNINAQGGGINNSQGGYIGASGDTRLSGSRVINQGGSIASNSSLQVSSTAADGIAIDNTRGGSIQSTADVKLYAPAAEIANTGGSIVSNNDLLVQSSGKVNNDQGVIKAGHDLSVVDAGVASGSVLNNATQTLSNQGGTLFAGNHFSIRNQGLSGAGSLQAQGGMQLAFAGNYTHQGELSVNGDLGVESGGDFTNQGSIKGGRSVTVSGNNVDNQNGAEISSAGVTTVNADQTLTNRGLIDGSDTRVNAGAVDNVGTGRIYGNHVSISTGTLNNRAENGSSATIASRGALDIGATVVNNLGGSTILSLGDMRFGGGVDANRMATGQAQTINNTGSKIDAAGSIHMAAAVVNNANAGIEIARLELVGTQAAGSLVQLPGQQPESASKYREVWDGVFIPYYNVSPFVQPDNGIPGSQSDGRIFKPVHPDKFLTVIPAAFVETVSCTSGDSSGDCTSTYSYEPAGSKRFAEYGVVLPANYSTVAPYPGLYGASADDAGNWSWPAGSNRAGYDAAQGDYEASIAAAKKLNDLILAENKENNRIETSSRDYTIIDGITESVYRDRVLSSEPGQITAGGNIEISGTLNNLDSTVIAGGRIQTGQLNNKPTVEGVESRESNGSAVYYSWKYHGGFSDSQERRASAPQTFTSAQSTTFDLPTVVFLQGQAGAGTGVGIGANSNTGQNAGSGGDGANGMQQSTGTTGSIAQQGGAASTPSGNAGVAAVRSQGYGASGSGAGTAPPTVTQQPITTATGEQVIVRAVSSGPALPGSSLYVIHAQNGNHPLVETDPAFTNRRNWLSSDYMLQALSLDPALQQKRLGDGFYEQQLIQQQIGQLTGRRFLGDYTSNDEQYRTLLESGATFAKTHGLRPGVELSKEQVAHLTSDLVWLVSQNVTMPDGSVQSVLVPKVYVMAKAGDLSATGTLISGDTVSVKTDGDVHNSGTIAGRRAVLIAANDINNMGGRIASDAVSLSAQRDINIVGGTVSAALQLLAEANNDINVVTTTRTTSGGTAQNGYSNTVIDRVAGLTLSGPSGAGTGQGGLMSLNAGKDVKLQGAQISNAGEGGATRVHAGNNVDLSTVHLSTDNRITWDEKNHLFFGGSQEAGTQINTQGSTLIRAGNDINARAAQVQTTQQLRLSAGNDINLTAGQATQSLDNAYFAKSSGLLGSSTRTLVDKVHQTQAQGSSLGGDTIAISAGRDITVAGSHVVSDNGTALQAGRNVNIAAVEETSSEQHIRKSTSSGFLGGGGGIGVTIGSRMQSTDQASTSAAAAGSTVGSVNGDVNIVAGNAYRQVGSDVMAPKGDINIVAKDIAITEAEQRQTSETHTRFKQSGLSISLGSALISAAQTAQSMAEAAGNTSDARMQALAAGAAALNVYNQGKEIGDAANALASGNPAAAGSISISVGSSKSQSDSYQSATSSRGSNVQAGGNVNLVATGAGKDSNILIQGSDITAGNDATLMADNQINLLASQDTHSDRSTNSSSSGSIGVSVGANTGITASVSKGKGHANSDDISHNNTHIAAGNSVTLQSGGDTHLQGAVVSGKQVIAEVGGDLNIESLQDSSRFEGRQQSSGGSITLSPAGVPTGGGLNAGRSKIDSHYQSVTEQSGIQAGDGGFQVSVKGNTDLQGAVIASTQTAVERGKNRFSTGGELTTSDLHNHAHYEGQAIGVNVNTGQQGGKHVVNGVGAGVGQDSGSAQGTTTAGISGIAGDQSVRTGDATGIERIFDQNKVQREIDAQVAITAEFGKQASKAAGTYADQQAIAARRTGNEAEAKKWDEGGEYRTALHTGIGALTGGLGGAVGAALSASALPSIGESIAALNLPDGVRDALNAAIGTALGSVGGASGAAAGLNQAGNNYISHSPFRQVRQTVSQENARLLNACGANCTPADFLNIDQQVAQVERAANLAAIGQVSSMTQQQVQELAQLMLELAPLYGTGESALQLITGHSSLTGEEASRLWAAIGVVPVAGGVLKKVGEPVAEAISQSLKRIANETKHVPNLEGANGGVVGRGIAYEAPSTLVQSRVDDLLAQIPANSQGRITMGVAVVEDANGVRSVVVSTSEPRGYLRPGVTLQPGETVIAGTGHAEADIVSYANANGLKIIDIGATRPVCAGCQNTLAPTGANITTPMKPIPTPKPEIP